MPGLYRGRCQRAVALRLAQGSLRHHPVKAKEVYRVGSVAEADAEVIQLPAGTPAFDVERIAYDYARPVRIRRLHHARGPLRDPLNPLRLNQPERPIMSTLYISRLAEPRREGRRRQRGRVRQGVAGDRRDPRQQGTGASLRLGPLGAAGAGDLSALRLLCRLQPADRPARHVAQHPRRRRRARTALARAHREVCREVPRPPAAQRRRHASSSSATRAAMPRASTPRSMPRSAA